MLVSAVLFYGISTTTSSDVIFQTFPSVHLNCKWRGRIFQTFPLCPPKLQVEGGESFRPSPSVHLNWGRIFQNFPLCPPELQVEGENLSDLPPLST